MNNNKLNFLLIFLFCTFFSIQSRGIKRYKNKKIKNNREIITDNLALNEASKFDSIASINAKEPVAIVQERLINGENESKQEQFLVKKEEAEDKAPIVPNIDIVVNNQRDNIEEQKKQKKSEEKEEKIIELNFENADLQNFIKQVEDIFEVTFISDDAIQPLAQGRKQIKGNKISFKTQEPMTKQEAWNLFVTFLEIAGFALVPQSDPRMYRISTIPTARKSPITAFIGVDYTQLPENDEIIRYVYFIQNSSVDAIKNVIDPLRSSASSLVMLKENKAFILTDKAYNIKTLMQIVTELDKTSMPQSMSILKLRRADAKQVKELYDSLIQPADRGTSRFFSKKQPTSLFFPESTRMIVEPRTNALVLLGPQDALKKIEDFIVKNIDVELDQPYSPLYTYQLKYADALTVADIMNNVTQYGKDSEAGKSGGVRGIDKYLRPMSFVAEKETNRLIIKAYYEDYLKAKAIIEKLDEAQPQIAIEVLILGINTTDQKQLGTQLRSKKPNGVDGLIGQNVEFQTSGLFGGTSKIIENDSATQGVNRLLGDILKTVVGVGAGNTILALGQDAFGVWGVFQALQTFADTEVISNPFLIATNKTPAVVYLGEERRIRTATIVGTSEVESFGSDEAKLEIKITPQINSDGMIVLDLVVTVDDFIDTVNLQDAAKNIRQITTSTIVANKEVLALGGLIRSRITKNQTKTPILGDIPILGWLFKNQSKTEQKQNLLILVSSRIIEANSERVAHEFTEERITDYYGTIDSMHQATQNRDPIHKLFFENDIRHEKTAENFLLEREIKKDTKRGIGPRLKNKKRGRKREKNEKNSPQPVQQKNKQLPKVDLVVANDTQILREKIRSKKRKKLSLTEFLAKDEPRA
ncbi:MAG: hypothetical protein WCD44_02610 [Candidatus Babeliales bacterium]